MERVCVKGACNHEPTHGKSATRGVHVEGVRMERVCVKGACNREPSHGKSAARGVYVEGVRMESVCEGRPQP